MNQTGYDKYITNCKKKDHNFYFATKALRHQEKLRFFEFVA